MKSQQSELLNLLSARTGHFRLESGHHGNLWLDLDPLFLHPARLQPFVAELVRRLSHYKVEGVCGPLTGGAFLAQAVASALAVEFYYAERFESPERNALYAVQYRIPASLRKTLVLPPPVSLPRRTFRWNTSRTCPTNYGHRRSARCAPPKCRWRLLSPTDQFVRGDITL